MILIANAEKASLLRPEASPHPTRVERDMSVPAGSMRILLVDPQSLTRDGVAMWLQTKLGDLSIAAMDNIEAATALGQESSTSLLLYHAGTGLIDTEQIARIMFQMELILPGVPVAILAADDSWDSIVATLRIGVRGYIPTGSHASVIIEAIRLLCAGGTYAPIASYLRHRPECAPDGLPGKTSLDVNFSSRQLQIISCLRRGFANKNIAYQLSMSEGTVKVHIRNIMKKIGARNRTQVVTMTSALDLAAWSIPASRWSAPPEECWTRTNLISCYLHSATSSR